MTTEAIREALEEAGYDPDVPDPILRAVRSHLQRGSLFTGTFAGGYYIWRGELVSPEEYKRRERARERRIEERRIAHDVVRVERFIRTCRDMLAGRFTEQEVRDFIDRCSESVGFVSRHRDEITKAVFG